MSQQTPNVADVVAYYVAKLALQYRGQPKAAATIALLVQAAVADFFYLQLQNCFNLDDAVGPQLDIIGKYVGVPRNIGVPAAPPSFGFENAAGTANPRGFLRAAGGANLGVSWIRANYSSGPKENLADATYAQIIKLQIILNSNDGTLASIENYLNIFFEGQVNLVDNKNMTLTYNVSSNVPISPTLLAAYLPKPMGVGITVNIY